MKFEEALDKAYEQMPLGTTPKGDNNYIKIVSLLWNMMAVSKNVLDDIVYISENNNIISMPLQKSSKKTAETEKPVEPIEDSNGKEKTKKKLVLIGH